MTRRFTLMLLILCAATSTAQVDCGDCDENGVTANILDALRASAIAAGLQTANPIQECSCDVDDSGSVNVLDALLTAQYDVGLPVTLTCPATICGCTPVTCGSTTAGMVGAPTCATDFVPGPGGDSTAYLIDASGRAPGEGVLVRLTAMSDDVDLYVPAGTPTCGDVAAAGWACASSCAAGLVDETHYFDDATVTAFGEQVPIWVRHSCAGAAMPATFDLEVTCLLVPPGMMTFTYTGMIETFVPPAGVTSVHIVVRGAQGEGGSGGALGGLGGEAEGDLAVVGGSTVLHLSVGGLGQAFNGGGAGGALGGGTGGGASDVRVGGTTLMDRVITAGGGGAGGGRGCNALWLGGDGGDGGGGAGTQGQDSPNGGGGFGGAPGMGGAEGIGCSYALGMPGLASGQGGDGQTCCCGGGVDNPGGGGGGGGYTVGGGGGSAGTQGCSGNDKGGGGGGGGGTSDISGVMNGTMTMGVHSGDGEIVISW